MKNIPTIFVWDNTARTVINKPLRMVDWVFTGKGQATRKWDGVAIRVEKGKAYRRHEWRPGEQMPNGFIKLQDADPKRPQAALPGWVPIPDTFLTKPQGTDERCLREAWLDKLKQLATIAALQQTKKPVHVNPYGPAPTKAVVDKTIPDGTYELCGPKIRGNHEGLAGHVLYLHGAHVVKSVPRTYEGLKKFLEIFEGEGIVWHYNMGGGNVLMAKIKRRDFGFHTRVSKEDIAMAYRKEEPKTGANGLTADEQKHADETAARLAGVFQADNKETGDDIHLGDGNAVA